jgi:mono/diheme cytochrome c family protein
VTRSRLLMMLVMAAACRPGHRLDLPPLTDAELIARAREDYVHACARCHGIDGRGADAASGDARSPDLTRLADRLGSRFSRQYIADVITGDRAVPAHGRREMPVWQYRFGRVESGTEAAGALVAQQRLDALAAYVESLQVRRGSRDER